MTKKKIIKGLHLILFPLLIVGLTSFKQNRSPSACTLHQWINGCGVIVHENGNPDCRNIEYHYIDTECEK